MFGRFQRKGRRAGPVRPAERRTRLTLQPLEDRTVPATIPGGATIEGFPYAQGAGFIPPDPVGAVGPSQVVSMVNTQIEWHTFAGVLQKSQTIGTDASGSAAGSFFAPLNPVNELFDPKVVYDQYAGRFVAMAMEQVDTSSTTSSRILVAVSKTSDPNAGWNYTAINSKLTIGSTATWADFPGLAIDSQAIYITGNMYGFGASGTFEGARLWIIDKSPFYTGGSAVTNLYDPATGSTPFTLKPAHVYGSAPSGIGTWLVASQSADTTNGSGNESLVIIQVNNPTRGNATFVSYNGTSGLDLGNISDESAAYPPGPQPGGLPGVDTNDSRMLDVVWRGGKLYATWEALPTTGRDAGQVSAHYAVINTAGSSAVGGPQMNLAFQGNVGGEDIAPGTFTYMPNIAVDSAGNVAIGFSASSDTVYPGAYYTVIPAGSTSPGASQLFAPGLGGYFLDFGSGDNRWGDYSGLALSPVDDSFWAFNEYALTPDSVGDGRWGTRWVNFRAAPAPGPVVVSANDEPGSLQVPASGATADNGLPDSYRLVRNGVNLEIYINGLLYNRIPVANVTSITVNGSSDADSLTLDFSGGNFFPSGGMVFNGGGGTDSISVVDDTNFDLSDTGLVLGGLGSITLSSVEQATITGGASANTFSVHDWSGTAALDGGEGGDTYTVAMKGNGTSQTVSIGDTGTSGTDVANIVGSPGIDAYTITPSQTIRGIETVNYDSSLERLNVSGQGGADSFNVTPSASTPIFIDGGPPSVVPGDSLTYNGSNFTLTPTGDRSGVVSGSGVQDVTFVDIEQFNGQTLASSSTSGGTTGGGAGGRTFSTHLVAMGTDVGGGPRVRVFNANGTLRFDFFAYDPNFRGGVRVAVGDVTGDGVDDIITVAGPGGGSHVKVFDGVTGQLVNSFFAFEPTFTGGCFVGVGDVGGDGVADIVVGAGEGGGPHVKVYRGGSSIAPFRDFFAFEPTFTGGVTVAVGDVNGDGFGDVIVGAGAGGGPLVRVFDGHTGATIQAFYAYDMNFTGGVFVAAGDIDGDGKAEIITGPGFGGGPDVRAFRGGRQILEFLAYDPSFTGGIRVAATDLDGNGTAEIITGTGPTGGPLIHQFSGLALDDFGDLFAFDPSFRGGVFVG